MERLPVEYACGGLDQHPDLENQQLLSQQGFVTVHLGCQAWTKAPSLKARLLGGVLLVSIFQVLVLQLALSQLQPTSLQHYPRASFVFTGNSNEADLKSLTLWKPCFGCQQALPTQPATAPCSGHACWQGTMDGECQQIHASCASRERMKGHLRHAFGHKHTQGRPWNAGKVLASGKGQQTRPMMGKVRSALFDMLLSLSSPNGAQFPAATRWLDLYAGAPAAVCAHCGASKLDLRLSSHMCACEHLPMHATLLLTRFGTATQCAWKGAHVLRLGLGLYVSVTSICSCSVPHVSAPPAVLSCGFLHLSGLSASAFGMVDMLHVSVVITHPVCHDSWQHVADVGVGEGHVDLPMKFIFVPTPHMSC